LYEDLVCISLSEDQRQELETTRRTMLGGKPYEIQSNFLKSYIAQGVVEGQVSLVLRLLTHRFGTLNVDVRARVEKASVEELTAIAERLLTAQTLQQALDPQ
jgi:hypothetical protein